MAIAEHDRHLLGVALTEAIGEEHSANLMALLPELDWDQVARREDVQRLEFRMESWFHDSEAETTGIHGDVSGVIARVAALGGDVAELKTGMSDMRDEINELKGESRTMRRDVKNLILEQSKLHLVLSGMESRLTTRMWTIVMANLGATIGIGGIVLTATKILG